MMKKIAFILLAAAVAAIPALAIDGQVLINQSTVMSAGGFPYTISQPGSYKLSGDLLVPSGAGGIVITAANVTLDLNGFSIVTPLQPTSSLSIASSIGVNFGPSAAPVAVRNGGIRGFLFPIGYAFLEPRIGPGAIGLGLPPNTVLEDLNLIWDGSTTQVFGISVSYLGRLTRVNAGGWNLLLKGLADLAQTAGCPAVVESSLFQIVDNFAGSSCVIANVATVAP